MNKIIVEVGSSCIKVDKFDGKKTDIAMAYGILDIFE